MSNGHHHDHGNTPHLLQNKQKKEHVWYVYHSLAGLDQYTRAMLNAVSTGVEMAK